MTVPLALDNHTLTCHHPLINNEGYSEEFLDTIKRAKLRIEAYYEEYLVENHATGAIFALKNFGWSDKHQTFIEMAQPDKRQSL